MKKNKIFLSAGILAVLLAAVLISFRGRDRNSHFELTEPIHRGSVLESVYGIGTVTARKSYQMKSGQTNYIRKLHVREGDRVRKGDSLLDLESTSFRAPFDGIVTWIPLKEGELAFAQSLMMSLVDLSDRYLVVSLDQRGALRVKQGQKARISFDSFREESFDGSVESIYSHENNFLVRIDVSHFPQQILPGMTADVAIGIREMKDVLLVPTSAINQGKVQVVREGSKAREIDVKIGIVDGVMAQVEAPELKEGDRLVLQKKANP